jgi:hypothetical protein
MIFISFHLPPFVRIYMTTDVNTAFGFAGMFNARVMHIERTGEYICIID